MDLMPLATEERADFVSLLAGLEPREWEQPTLCGAWRVRDVAAHVISYDVLSPPAAALRFLRGGLSLDRANAIGVERAKSMTTDQILEQFRATPRPSGLMTIKKGAVALTDGMIHQQDIRRALDKPRRIPPARLGAALSFAMRALPLPAREVTGGLRLVADDLDWVRGSGLEVRGHGEALLMALAGRGAALEELSGDGVETLRARLSA